MIFDPKDIRFTPAGIGSLTDEELRAAYEDLAGTAKSELNRIKRSKVFGDAAVVERNKDYYPSSKKLIVIIIPAENLNGERSKRRHSCGQNAARWRGYTVYATNRSARCMKLDIRR